MAKKPNGIVIGVTAILTALAVGDKTPWWFPYFFPPKKMECIAGINAVRNDTPPEKQPSASKYDLNVSVDNQTVFSDSTSKTLEPGAPFGGPFTNWKELDFDKKVKIIKGNDVIFKIKLSNISESEHEWLGVQEIHLICDGEKYSTIIDDRKDAARYGTGGRYIGIILANGETMRAISTL